MGEKKDSPMLKTPGHFIRRFAERTSVVGPSYISTSQHFSSKAFWTILFLGAIGMTIYMVVSNFIRFFSWNTNTGIALGYTQLAFPMVTICNSNAVRKSYLKEGGPMLMEFLDDLNPESFKRTPNTPNTVTSDPPLNGENTQNPNGRIATDPAETATEGTTPPMNPGPRRRRKKRFINANQQNQKFNQSFIPDNYFDFEDDIEGENAPQYEVEQNFNYLMSEIPRNVSSEMGHQLGNMLLYCSFEGKECSENNFTEIQINGYGNCYRFNSGGYGDSYISRRTGVTYGLQLIMYLETKEYIKGLTLGYGMKLAISQSKTFPPLESEGMFVSAGTETSIGMQLLNITRLSAPYGTCAAEDGNTFLNQLGLVYTRLACQETCEPKMIHETCGCYERGMDEKYPNSILESGRNCEQKDRACVNQIKKGILDTTISCDCPTACNESIYQTTVTSREWPEETYMYSLIDAVCSNENTVDQCEALLEMSETNQRRNFVKVNIFYRDLNYEIISQVEDYSDTSFFSDLGGAIGLWVGFSVLGLVEVIQLVLEIAYSFCKSVGRKSEISAFNDKNEPNSRNQYSLQSNEEKTMGGYDLDTMVK